VSRFRSAAASATLGGALSAVAFGAQTGTDLGSSATVSVLVALGAGAMLALFLLRGMPGPPVYGATAVALLGAFTVVTALSAAWSIAPADTAAEAGRTLAYLFAFAAAVAAARQYPDCGKVVTGALAVAGVTVCGWALTTRIWPGALGDDLLLTGRLGAPFGYWNALGGMAALAVPAVLWLGARRESSRAVAGLAYAAMGILLLTILLTQSRGALAAVLLVLVGWFVLVPLRLRSAPALLLPGVAVAPVAAWALSRDQFTAPSQSVSAQDMVASDFGLLVLALCAGLLAAGVLAHHIASRSTSSLRLRRRAGTVLVAAACLVPLVALAAVATTDRGLGGTVSDRFQELTDETDAPPSGSGRLASASSSRGEYWRQAGKIFEERRLLGRGANTFGLARLPYRTDGRAAAHAHGFFAQTLADLGLIGVILALGLLGAWAAAAVRTLGLVPRRRQRPEWSDDRVALAALALCALAFGLHSAIDWTWSIPGTAVAALVAAGFVAGRGPVPVATASAAAKPEPSRPSADGLDRGRALAAAVVLVTTLLCCWAIWQPQSAARANERALDSLVKGDFARAEREAVEARDKDPYSPDPLFALASALSGRGQRLAAYRVLEQVVREHPRDPDTWLRLAEFELRELDLPQRATETVGGAFRIDPRSRRLAAVTLEVQAALASLAPAPAPVPVP